MNLKSRLQHIATMMMKDRQLGRTTMIAKAVEATGGMMLTHSHKYAKDIERTFKIPARSIELNLEGFSGPFFLDHHATEALLMRASKKIDALEKENAALKNYLKEIVNTALTGYHGITDIDDEFE